jgi:CspA family cold shock protein
MATQFCPKEIFVYKNLDFADTYTRLMNVLRLCLVAMANGKVDFFNDTGGYGFIATEDSDDDVFFHMEDVGGEDLTEGTEVEFEIEDAPKGPRAKNVVRN